MHRRVGKGYNGRFKAVFPHKIVEAVCAAVGADCVVCFSLSSTCVFCSKQVVRARVPRSRNTKKAFSLIGWLRTRRANGEGGASVRKNCVGSQSMFD